ncbi:MAG: hypothetical protein EON58_20280 [Alphaproteobacteria bacterium]|nr:MAG: hypothetical protein EON58_20280 [Alphaproteobacteria bacterium]
MLTMGREWALELVEFYFWRGRRGLKTTPGFLTGTWKNWLAGNGVWDDKFEKELDRAGRARSLGSLDRIRQRMAWLQQKDKEQGAAATEKPASADSAPSDAAPSTEQSETLKAPVRPLRTAPAKPNDAPATRNDWSPEEVPEAERADLLAEAQEATLKLRIYNTDKSRKRVESSGWDHPGVRIEAQRILKARATRDRGSG